MNGEEKTMQDIEIDLKMCCQKDYCGADWAGEYFP